MGHDGAVLLTYTQAREILDHLKTLCASEAQPDLEAWARFDKDTRQGRDMHAARELLAKAVASVAGKKEERAVASLFSPGGTHALKGEFAGINEYEVVAYLLITSMEQ